MEGSFPDPAIIHSNDERGLDGTKSDLKASMENGAVEKRLSGTREINGSREIDDEQPNSLRLESVLEYTNRIKTFLGLQDEKRDADANVPFNSTTDTRVENYESKEKVSGDGFNVDTSSNEKLHIDEDIDEGNSHPDSDISAPPYNQGSYPKLSPQPLPDIIGTQTDSLEEVEREKFPDILERGKNFNVDKSEDIFTNNSDITTDELNDPSLISNTIREIDETSIATNDHHHLSESVFERVPVEKAESAVKAQEKELHGGRTNQENEREVTISQNNDLPSILHEKSKESNVQSSEQDLADANVSDQTEEVRNEEVSEDESPYQITHIEEGLRQTEKTLPPPALPEKAAERQDVEHFTDTNPSSCLKRRSRVSMEDIRRLSTEVVNTVLQTAGDEIKVLLQDGDSTIEENKPSVNLESPDEPEIILPLQDTEVEYRIDTLDEVCLADIPEEESQQTFSDMIDISSENITSSIAMNDIPVGSKHSIDRIEVTDEIDIDAQCGFGPFKPQCIQAYATANVYVVLYSIIGILHGSYYTYLVGVLTTLEKRFEFKSKTSGFIMMLDELTPLFLGVLVGHFGGRAHRPRLLSFGMFLSAFCCFASALPYFLYGTATHLSSIGSVHNRTSTEMCDGDVRMEHCDEDDRPPTLTAILLLMLGSFLKGFGNLAYYAIGLAYLDDNAKKRNTPLYFAVAFALRLLGPMVGFLMSSAFLKYYENPFETPDFGPDDPRWIGGWWMGFVLQGVLLLIFAGPMALFPRRLPDHRPLMHEIEHNSNNMFDGLGDSLKRLAKNPLYILIGLNAIFTVYGNFGYYIMLPKYMENQFRLSASSASLFAGPPGIAALMCSCIIGGYLIWKFKPTAKFLAGGLVTLELISTIGYLILMIPQCEKIDMTQFGMSEEGLILENACNSNCSCSTVSFTPVCGPEGKSFFSPCYAGCSSQQDQSFYNCSCVGNSTAVVTKGMCSSENCWSQALAYIATLPVLQFMVNILRVAYTMIMLRSILPEDKNIALGVFETVLSTIAFIPFPVLYGALVDSACLVWEKSCGETGNCWFYDIQKFNHLMHGGSAFFCALSTINLVAIFFLVDRIKDLYKDEEDHTDSSRGGKS